MRDFTEGSYWVQLKVKNVKHWWEHWHVIYIVGYSISTENSLYCLDHNLQVYHLHLSDVVKIGSYISAPQN